jgi:hypothetical protein
MRRRARQSAAGGFRQRRRLLTIGRHSGLSLCSHVRAREQRRPWWVRLRSGAPTLAARRARDEGARARIRRGLRAAMHALRDWARLVGVALPCSLPAGSGSGPPLRGQPRRGRGDGHHAGVLGFRVDGRSRRAVSGVRGAGAVVAVLVPRASSGAAQANPRRDTAAPRGNARAGALSGAPRRWKALLVRKLVLAVHAASAEGRRGVSVVVVAARPAAHGETRSARGSSGTRPSGRERRNGGRAAGRSG